jgi:hypothetical protein
MLSDAELEGFVEFGADQEEVLATQRRLNQQQRAAAAAADVEAPAAGPDAVPGVEEEAGSKRPSRRSRGAAAAREAASRQQVPDDLLPKVAIIGRPNVGKSGELLSCRRSAVCYVQVSDTMPDTLCSWLGHGSRRRSPAAFSLMLQRSGRNLDASLVSSVSPNLSLSPCAIACAVVCLSLLVASLSALLTHHPTLSLLLLFMFVCSVVQPDCGVAGGYRVRLPRGDTRQVGACCTASGAAMGAGAEVLVSSWAGHCHWCC